MKNQTNRLHKTENEETSLLEAIKKLHKKFDSDEIFDALVSVATGSDEGYLADAAISYLNIIKGMNVVKVEGLNQQYEFETAMQHLFPYDNERQTNLFTA